MWLIGLMLMVVLSVGAAAAQEAPGLQLVSAASLSELDDALRERNITLAPDGSALAWGSRRELCLYGFAEDEATCSEIEGFRGFGRFSYLSWSPDSDYLAFNETLFDNFYESDIWIYDVAAQQPEKRTEDGFDQFELGDAAEGMLLDYAPTWNPANGDLYFFRSTRQDDGYSTELYLLPPSQTEPKRVRDLTADFPVLSVYRPPVISPDGTRMAMIVLAQNPRSDDRSGVWTLDLGTDGELKQVARLADLQGGMPEWMEDYLLLPDSVAWAGDSGLVVMGIDFQTRQPIASNAYFVDLAGETVQPLVDFSDLESAEALVEASDDELFPILRVPKGGAVTPDGSTWVYVGTGRPATGGGTVWAVNLPPDGSEAAVVGAIDRYEVGPWSESRSSFSDDGSKALIWGYVLEFE